MIMASQAVLEQFLVKNCSGEHMAAHASSEMSMKNVLFKGESRFARK